VAVPPETAELLRQLKERAPKDEHGAPTGLVWPELANQSRWPSAMGPYLLELGAHPAYAAVCGRCNFFWDPKRVHVHTPHEQEARFGEWNAALERYVKRLCVVLLHAAFCMLLQPCSRRRGILGRRVLCQAGWGGGGVSACLRACLPAN
jgi:hypothetical protein